GTLFTQGAQLVANFQLGEVAGRRILKSQRAGRVTAKTCLGRVNQHATAGVVPAQLETDFAHLRIQVADNAADSPLSPITEILLAFLFNLALAQNDHTLGQKLFAAFLSMPENAIAGGDFRKLNWHRFAQALFASGNSQAIGFLIDLQ